LFIAVLGMMAAAGVAAAADPAPAAAPAAKDYVLSHPTDSQFDRFRPDRPAANNPARVTISCTAQPDQTLGDCTVVKEIPEGVGFGAATLRLSKTMHLTRPAGWTPGAPETIVVIVNWPQKQGNGM
jgi:hypothetical protein